jgi:hypothetical protein
MTITVWQSAALERIIVLLAAMIAKVFGIIVGLVAANAGTVRNVLPEPCARGPARRHSPGFARAVMGDLAGKGEALTETRFTKPQAREPLRMLMTVDRNGSMLLADITAVAAPIVALTGTKLAIGPRGLRQGERAADILLRKVSLAAHHDRRTFPLNVFHRGKIRPRPSPPPVSDAEHRRRA